MSKKFFQLEKYVRLFCGYLLFPFLLTFGLWKAGFTDYNITGLLNLSHMSIATRTIAVCMLVWILRTLYIISQQQLMIKEKMQRYIFLFAICALLAIFIPYIVGTIYSTLHLLFSYVSFFLFNLILFYLLKPYSICWQIYLCVILFAILLCFTAGQITGLSELIYAITVSVLLSYISK